VPEGTKCRCIIEREACRGEEKKKRAKETEWEGPRQQSNNREKGTYEKKV